MPRKSVRSALPRQLERAIAAAAALDAAAKRSPVRAGWLQRSRIAAAQRLAACDGEAADPDRLLAALLDLPIRRTADGGAIIRALGWLRLWLEADTAPALDRPAAADWTGRIGPASFQASSSASAGVHVALACLVTHHRSGRAGVVGSLPVGVAAAIAQGVPFAAALAAIPYALQVAGIVTEAWPALSPVPDGPTDDSLWPSRLFEAFADQAERELAALDRLEMSWRHWHIDIGALRGNSRLPQLLHLAASLPGLSSAYVARRLGTAERPCTVPGASFLLNELGRRGVLVEVSLRQSWRLYVPADLAHLQLLPRRGRGTMHRPAAEPERADLLGDDRPAVSLEGMIVTRIEHPAVSSAVEADWTELIADIERATQRAKGLIERTTGAGAPE